MADAEALPFPDDRFDAAVGGFVLNHLPHPARCAEECARVVAPGGRVAFAVWERPERSRLIALLGEALERAGGDRGAGVPEGPDDFRYADGGRMRRLLEGAGLEEVDVATVELDVRRRRCRRAVARAHRRPGARPGRAGRQRRGHPGARPGGVRRAGGGVRRRRRRAQRARGRARGRGRVRIEP